MSLIRLQTTDGDIHEWAKEKAMMSNTLKDMIEAIPEETDKAIPLQQISSATLKKVEEWVEYHCNDQKDSDSDSDDDETCAKCVDEMTAWDTKYFDMEREAFFALLEAANYLHIEGLLKTGCKMAAKQVDDKSAEDVQKIWGIECDLSPETVQRLKKENAWAEKEK